jgi:hypothetical protein
MSQHETKRTKNLAKLKKLSADVARETTQLTQIRNSVAQFTKKLGTSTVAKTNAAAKLAKVLATAQAKQQGRAKLRANVEVALQESDLFAQDVRSGVDDDGAVVDDIEAQVGTT